MKELYTSVRRHEVKQLSPDTYQYVKNVCTSLGGNQVKKIYKALGGTAIAMNYALQTYIIYGASMQYLHTYITVDWSRLQFSFVIVNIQITVYLPVLFIEHTI